ncbi:hypothetical protein EV03_1176 [Prochlorococcus marinus str. PAC1]|uniref:Glycine zipper 2TM domain-containing protein n=1 Tax=Prochlorococcus marinus str. PAC1 TaxID=59924 RepID=A0A0A2C712_PROMR|nr:hypothetical protein EV03_1176 [Prochlorococcus marinus str. PAC1]
MVALLLLSSVPVNAHESQRGYTTQRSCYKETYKEEYVAGTIDSKGYVKSFLDKVEVPCSPLAKVHRHHRPVTSYNHSRTRYYQPTTTYRVSRSNSPFSACRSSRATGGVLGGGLAAAVSKKDAWGWSIPLGAVIGLGVGDANC